MRKLGEAFRKTSRELTKTEFDAIRDTLRKEGADSTTNNGVNPNETLDDVLDALDEGEEFLNKLTEEENNRRYGETETMPPTNSRMLYVKKDNENKYYSLEELEKHIIEDLALSHTVGSLNRDVNIDIGTIPASIYQDILILAQNYNLFQIGYHPDGVWYALMGDRLIWSRPEIITEVPNNPIITALPKTEIPMKEPPKRFNRYTALTERNGDEKNNC